MQRIEDQLRPNAFRKLIAALQKKEENQSEAITASEAVTASEANAASDVTEEPAQTDQTLTP